MPDYDFYHGLYSGQQVDSAVARALVGGQLDQDIAAIRAAVGSPLVANAAAEMTNINKIYVYTGSEAGYSTGHWYYYENGSWQDGGLYNSAAADDEMSDSSTNAVQNKVIKEYVDTTASDLSGDIGDVRTDLGTAIYTEQTRAEAVEATKADKSYADYILLREEEDRQILFGSIVEAATDEYSELRSSPIHNAISIGGSVYPRMDRTRMAIDAIKGRTVAFNQIAVGGDFASTSGWLTSAAASISVEDNVLALEVMSTSAPYVYRSLPVVNGHKYFAQLDIKADGAYEGWVFSFGSTISASYGPLPTSWERRSLLISNTGTSTNVNIIRNATGTVGQKVYARNFILIDLTAMYGTTLADQIYAMEQATTGAGVAYVRQRMDLDYYASNAGELKAPVVSGVSFTGANVFDISVADWKHNKRISTTDGSIVDNNSFMYGAYYYPALPAGRYTMRYIKGTGGNLGVSLALYDSAKVWQQNLVIAPSTSQTGEIVSTFDFPVGFAYFRVGTIENDYNPTLTISGGNSPTTEPYKEPFSLPLPSIRLDGVGTAQDVMYVREDGENDYSLIKTAKMNLVDLGTLNWAKNTSYDNPFFYATAPTDAFAETSRASNRNGICPNFVWYVATGGNVNYFVNIADKSIALAAYGLSSSNRIYIRDDSYSDAATFKTAMNGVMFAYKKQTPTETVIAEHLTLADISAIAQNGGIISVENSNGHIVQPDFVADVVISRSAS